MYCGTQREHELSKCWCLYFLYENYNLYSFLSHNLVEFITINKKQFNTKEVYVVIRNLWSNELITTSMHFQGNLKSK